MKLEGSRRDVMDSLLRMRGRICHGFGRFAPFCLCAIAVAVLVVLGNHYVLRDAMIQNLSRGLYWGALASVFVRVLGECQDSPLIRKGAWAVAVAVGALGCWFWSAIYNDSPLYWPWTLLYGGSLVALVSSIVLLLYHSADERSLFPRLVLNALCVGGVAVIFIPSLILCLSAYHMLVAPVSGAIFQDVAVALWLVIVPVGFMILLPGREADDGASDRATAFLFWILLPASLILLGILYLYIGKIVLTATMPSGKLNWFGSVSLAAYAFFWLSLRDSRRSFFRSFVRWGWALLLPVLAAQVIGIVIRYQAYGLSATRFAGMITLSCGVCALVLSALNRRPQGLFAYMAVAGLVFSVTPFNIFDVPVRNQERRLRAALDRNGLLRGNELEVPADVTISDADAKIILGAWDYLTDSPTVWHRLAFTKGLQQRIMELSRQRHPSNPSLSFLLGLTERGAQVGPTMEGMTFRIPTESGWPIDGYSRLRVIDDGVVCLYRSSKDRWMVKWPEGEDWSETFDITAHVERTLKAAGFDGVIRKEKRILDMKPEDAVWTLKPSLALAIGAIRVSGREGSAFTMLLLSRCAVLTRACEKGVQSP